MLSGPETLITDMAPKPDGVANAIILSLSIKTNNNLDKDTIVINMNLNIIMSLNKYIFVTYYNESSCLYNPLSTNLDNIKV